MMMINEPTYLTLLVMGGAVDHLDYAGRNMLVTDCKWVRILCAIQWRGEFEIVPSRCVVDIASLLRESDDRSILGYMWLVADHL